LPSAQNSLTFFAIASRVPTAGLSLSFEEATGTMTSTSSASLHTTYVSATLQIDEPGTGTRPPTLTSFLHKDDVTKAELM